MRAARSPSRAANQRLLSGIGNAYSDEILHRARLSPFRRTADLDDATGEELGRWEAGGPIATLAYDPEAPRLLVGRADAGTVPVAAAPPAAP